MKKFLTVFFLTSSIALFGQSYRVNVETYVANKLEDKFSFTLKEGDTQTKGFDGRILAKRYRANGYMHKGILEKEALEKEEKLAKKRAMLKPADKVKKMLDAARKACTAAETRLATAEGAKEAAEQKVKELEELESLAARGAFSFQKAYDDYMQKNGLTEASEKVEKLFRKRPKDTGDVDEIDLGSFCRIKLEKASDKKVMVSLDYAYSRIMSYFYSDGNNNDNTITKHPIFERFEKLEVSNLVLTMGKQYCYQFARVSPEKARSLSDAMAQTGIFGGGDATPSANAQAAQPEVEKNPLDTEGDFKEIKRKFASDSGKVVRVVITLKADN